MYGLPTSKGTFAQVTAADAILLQSATMQAGIFYAVGILTK
jgi:hypothetical protein